MEKELALFIEDLEFGLNTTNQAEDRHLYEKYLARAACIISKVILNSSKEELFEAIETYDRTAGYSWLINPVSGKNPKSYENFKKLAKYQR